MRPSLGLHRLYSSGDVDFWRGKDAHEDAKMGGNARRGRWWLKARRSGELAITEKCRELSSPQAPTGSMPNGARRFGELNSHEVYHSFTRLNLYDVDSILGLLSGFAIDQKRCAGMYGFVKIAADR